MHIVPGIEQVVNKCFKNELKGETGYTLIDLWKSLSIFTFYNQASSLIKLKYQY